LAPFKQLRQVMATRTLSICNHNHKGSVKDKSVTLFTRGQECQRVGRDRGPKAVFVLVFYENVHMTGSSAYGRGISFNIIKHLRNIISF
jgi:hypothetical protein